MKEAVKETTPATVELKATVELEYGNRLRWKFRKIHMVTQSIRPESLSTDDWRQIFARPSADGGSDGDETCSSALHSFDDYDSLAINQIVAVIAVDVLMTDADQRLDYLQAVNPSLTYDQLDQIAETTDQWLNRRARNRIRAIARRCFDNGSSPRNVLVEWNTSEELKRLIGLLTETSVLDKTLAICYAMAAAQDAASAAYFVHSERTNRRTDFTGIEQTPEEIAADLRFANSR